MNNNILKKLAAETAIDTLIQRGHIHNGMKIGLGTGSTALPAVYRLGYHIQQGTLSCVRAVVTSMQTQIACEDLGIPVYSMKSRDIGGALDLAIDGADEISPEKHLIKGGGAALLREKIVAYNAKIFVVVADFSKEQSHIGTNFPLPIEVIPEARVAVANALQKLGAKAVLREAVRKAGPVITDNGNVILDALWDAPPDAAEMEVRINSIPGVVETGFFTANTPMVFTALEDGTVRER
jgi:ribose 5-phosphate isomerase A